MHIAIVINASWNIYNFRFGLIKALQAEGHRITAIAPEDDYSQLLINAGCGYVPVKMDSKGTNVFADLSLFFRFRRIYKRIRPDIILHYTIKPNVYGTPAAKMLKIPIINNVSGLGTVFIRKNFTSLIARLLYKLSFRFATHVFFQNKDDMVLFLKGKRVKNNKCSVIPGSGVDISRFVPQQPSPKEKFTFLLISRLLIDKGIREYFDAVKMLVENEVSASFQLLGGTDFSSNLGIGEEELNQRISDSTIDYLGTAKDVRPFINQADCVVLFSYREGTPRTLLEAAACGKPLIATDVPGCREVIEEGVNGWFCRPKDAADAAAKMQKMITTDFAQITEMGQQSRKLIEKKFDEKIVIKHYLSTITRIKNTD